MHSRLNRIEDWSPLAREARYSVNLIARKCGVSPRQLERYFHIRFQKSPHAWLRELRMRRAVELLRDGSDLKQVADQLCYREASHFHHDFKAYFGVTPGSLVQKSEGFSSTRQMSHLSNKGRI